MPERLRGSTRNRLGNACAGSSPVDRVFDISFLFLANANLFFFWCTHGKLWPSPLKAPDCLPVDFPFSFLLANLSLQLQMKFAQTIERVRSHAIHLIFKTPSTPNYPRVRPIPLSILASDEVGGGVWNDGKKRASSRPSGARQPLISAHLHFHPLP